MALSPCEGNIPPPKKKECVTSSTVGSGLPALPCVHLQRPDSCAAWRAPEVGTSPASPPLPGEDARGLTHRELCQFDPLAGLLATRLLERLTYLLTDPAVQAATETLLALLARWVSHRAVCRVLHGDWDQRG